MIGFGNSDWSYDPFEKMVIFPPDPLPMTTYVAKSRALMARGGGAIRDQGPGGAGGVSFSPNPTKTNKGGPPHQGGKRRRPLQGAESRHS